MTASRGYTMVELLAVLAILSILAMGVAPLAEMASQRQKERELRKALWQVRDALDAFKRAADQGLVTSGASEAGYPTTLSVLADGVRAPDGRLLRFLRSLPRDPFAPDGLPPEQTWSLRSHDSPVEAPRPGRDVYDIHSSTTRLASDGSRLAAW